MLENQRRAHGLTGYKEQGRRGGVSRKFSNAATCSNVEKENVPNELGHPVRKFQADS